MKILKKHFGLIISLLCVLVLVAWPLITGKPAQRETVFTILRAIALASSLNIFLGYTGYVSFGHIVFYGLGGYVGFYFLTQHGLSLWTSMMIGGLSSALLALMVGKAILRLRGAYFALATIGVNEAVRAFINNFDPFGGPVGIMMNFKTYKEYGGAAQSLQMAFYIMAGITFLVILLSYIIRTSKFGLGLLAIREDEDAAEVIGINSPNAKTWAYILSAIIPGIIGVLFFFKNGNVEPHPAFPLHLSIETIVMVMLGGQGTVLGPVIGGAGYIGLRSFLLTNPFFKNIQLAVAGVFLLVIVLFVPSGIVGWIRNRFPKTRRILK